MLDPTRPTDSPRGAGAPPLGRGQRTRDLLATAQTFAALAAMTTVVDSSGQGPGAAAPVAAIVAVDAACTVVIDRATGRRATLDIGGPPLRRVAWWAARAVSLVCVAVFIASLVSPGAPLRFGAMIAAAAVLPIAGLLLRRRSGSAGRRAAGTSGE